MVPLVTMVCLSHTRGALDGKSATLEIYVLYCKSTPELLCCTLTSILSLQSNGLPQHIKIVVSRDSTFEDSFGQASSVNIDVGASLLFLNQAYTYTDNSTTTCIHNMFPLLPAPCCTYTIAPHTGDAVPISRSLMSSVHCVPWGGGSGLWRPCQRVVLPALPSDA